MPYDISQLKDMLIPELADIAESMSINNIKGLDKQTLIYKILDQQALNNDNGQHAEDDAKKKRGRKPKTENTSAEKNAAAGTDGASEEREAKPKRARKPRTTEAAEHTSHTEE